MRICLIQEQVFNPIVQSVHQFRVQRQEQGLLGPILVIVDD